MVRATTRDERARVYIEHTDAYGVVFYANYFAFASNAAEALEMIKCDLEEARGDLRRKDVFIYVDASPPCNGICFVNSGPGFAGRRQEGIKLTKDIHEKLLEPLWKENAIDAYVLENTHDCIFEW